MTDQEMIMAQVTKALLDLKVAGKLQPGAQPAQLNLSQMIRQYERQLICQQVQEAGGTADAKREVAKQLGISVATLYRKMGEEP